MKKLTLAASAIALLALFPAVAMAAQSMATITNIDPNSVAIVLSDGYTYPLPPSVPLSSVHIGDHVVVTYTVDATTGKRTASAVMPSN